MIRLFNDPNDDLSTYAQWVVSEGLCALIRPVEGIVHYDPATAVILHRDGCFQAELYVFPAGKDIPAHDHPAVDSIEVQICGALDLVVEGKSVMDMFPMERRGTAFMNRGFRIPAGAVHSVSVGPCGASFLSIQKWHGKEPTSIGDDWRGVTYSVVQRQRHLNG